VREIRTQKIGSHIMNSHIKRPRVTVNQRIGSRKEAISGSHVCEIADKKTAYNEGCLYFHFRCIRYGQIRKKVIECEHQTGRAINNFKVLRNWKISVKALSKSLRLPITFIFAIKISKNNRY